MSKTLYVTRNGLLEPLGQSQVFAYLRRLSSDYEITLITYEKPEDWANTNRVAHARAECEAHDIRWLSQHFRPGPRIIAPALSMLRMIWLVWREVRAGRVELIHARSYIPAAVALVVHRLTGAPFIFDMRALWPEELITAGRLKRGSMLHKAMLVVERSCLDRSAAVISLTHAAVVYLKRIYPAALGGQRVEVIPTCADLDRFMPSLGRPEGRVVHGCIGTILSGWFRTDWLSAWLLTVAAEDPNATFDIVTRDDADLVRTAIDPTSALGDRLSVGAKQPEEMPEAVSGHSVSVMFFTDGLSKLGSAPTRLAEVLGSGLPVVVNEGVGDVADIVRGNRVGVVLDGPKPIQVKTALDELKILMQDPDLARRCRDTSEALFSLEVGAEAYRSVYQAILNGENNVCAA